MIYAVVTTLSELKDMIASSGTIPETVILGQPHQAEVKLCVKTPDFAYDERGVAGVVGWRYVTVIYRREHIRYQDSLLTLHHVHDVKETREG